MTTQNIDEFATTFGLFDVYHIHRGSGLRPSEWDMLKSNLEPAFSQAVKGKCTIPQVISHTQYYSGVYQSRSSFVYNSEMNNPNDHEFDPTAQYGLYTAIIPCVTQIHAIEAERFLRATVLSRNQLYSTAGAKHSREGGKDSHGSLLCITAGASIVGDMVKFPSGSAVYLSPRNQWLKSSPEITAKLGMSMHPHAIWFAYMHFWGKTEGIPSITPRQFRNAEATLRLPEPQQPQRLPPQRRPQPQSPQRQRRKPSQKPRRPPRGPAKAAPKPVRHLEQEHYHTRIQQFHAERQRAEDVRRKYRAEERCRQRHREFETIFATLIALRYAATQIVVESTKDGPKNASVFRPLSFIDITIEAQPNASATTVAV